MAQMARKFMHPRSMRPVQIIFVAFLLTVGIGTALLMLPAATSAPRQRFLH